MENKDTEDSSVESAEETLKTLEASEEATRQANGETDEKTDQDIPEDTEGGEKEKDVTEEHQPEEKGQPEQQEAQTGEGLDLESMSSEYLEGGELSEDSFKQLEDAGIPRHYVDAYLDGLSAQSDLAKLEIANDFGGIENYNTIVGWAEENLNDTEWGKLEAAFNKGDRETFSLALEGIQARYESQHGSLDIPSYSGTAGNVNTARFSTQEELLEAIGDPRYKSSESYRKSVEKKLSRSRGIMDAH